MEKYILNFISWLWAVSVNPRKKWMPILLNSYFQSEPRNNLQVIVIVGSKFKLNTYRRKRKHYVI